MIYGFLFQKTATIIIADTRPKQENRLFFLTDQTLLFHPI